MPVMCHSSQKKYTKTRGVQWQRKPREAAVKYYPYSTFRPIILGQKTLHGVGAITKLYFAILRRLRNNDLESRAEVIQGHTFWRQSKARVGPTTLQRTLIVTFALSSTVSEMLPILYAPSNCVSK